MPRSPRLDYPGARHHVMNRTSRRRHVFRKPSDLELFLGLLGELPGRFGVSVRGYALMGNHFHLMLACHASPLAKVMAWLGSNLARRKNNAHGWDGPLFRARYRNRLVLDDDYWRHLLAYIHLNPLRAGAVAHPDETTWTSHRAYAGLDPAPSWLSCDEHLELYGSARQYRDALDDLVSGEAKLPEVLDEAHVWRPVNTEGVEVNRPPATVSSLSQADALAQVAAVAGVDVDSLLRARRGRIGNLPRTLAAWWLGRAGAMSRERVGHALFMRPGSVGAAAHRVRVAEGSLAEWRDALLTAYMSPLSVEGAEE